MHRDYIVTAYGLVTPLNAARAGCASLRRGCEATRHDHEGSIVHDSYFLYCLCLVRVDRSILATCLFYYRPTHSTSVRILM